MVELLNRCTYPDSWGFKRVPRRPPELQIYNFEKYYDYDTLFADAVQINDNTVILIGPPLYEVSEWIKEECYFQDHMGQRLSFNLTYLAKANRIELAVFDYTMQDITLVTPRGNATIKVNPISMDFRAKKTITTVSQDNPIAWIKQWIDYHYTVHDITGFLIYNNNSTIYTSKELEKELERNDVTIRIVDYAIPYGALGGGHWEWQGRTGEEIPWDSEFGQCVMFEHAKWRWLHSSDLVINADIDELLVLPNKTLDELSRYMEDSPNSFWIYKGTWVEPVDTVTGEMAENIPMDDRNFGNYALISNDPHGGVLLKWMCKPGRNIVSQWFVHGTTGPHMVTNEITFAHYLPINTGWSYKRDLYTGGREELREWPELAKHLAVWKANTTL
jgi:hypothetical protein